MKELIANGHELILFTMRSDSLEPKTYDKEIISKSGMYLSDALIWFEENKIPLFGINVNPEQHIWTKSPKAYAELYIDDAALGIPLVYGQHDRPFVDWVCVKFLLEQKGIIKI